MLRFVVLTLIFSVALAWDPHLKVAEKIAIPHHIRHGYDYPYINIAQMVNRNVRQGLTQQQGFSQQVSPFGAPQQQSLGFRQPAPAFQPNRGFQNQPFDQNRGFGSSPARQTRYFDLGVPRSSSFFDRRFS